MLTPPVRVARHAMATRFEVALHGRRPEALRAAAEEALDEVERIENLISLYRPQTDIGRINAQAGGGAVRVAPETFRLLERARALSERTDGAFDITAGLLVRVWGFHGGTGRSPDPGAVGDALARTGWSRVVLDPASSSVRLEVPGAMLDLGAMGKGYALDCAVERLREAGVESAILHGGTSTVAVIGAPPGREEWSVALAAGPEGGQALTVGLREGSLSVSAGWGRSFVDGTGRSLGHVLDPRTGCPVSGTSMAAVALPSAAESDALSTALLVLGQSGRDRLIARYPGIRIWTAPS
ncbi:MAG: FAD:protein FMN transferase [Verrucomicrobiales bacterium]|nr:FAD:protein FMN transferase [Verrucomicrobiales bacterium]